MRRAVLSVVLGLVLVWLAGCSALPRIGAVPDRFVARAVLPGLDDVRYVVGDDQDMRRLTRDMVETWPRERAWLTAQGKPVNKLPPSNILALSGGGDNGAFGAGLLNGWTASGARPEFLLVTDISTGALIAPFAFLGPKYDEMLRDFYTRTQPKDIINRRNWWAVLTDDSIADTAPLRTLLRKHIDRAFLDEVAAEHAKGRELWISTTNLESRRVRYSLYGRFV